MADLIITVEDLRRLRNAKGDAFCIPGIRKWTEAHGVDFAKFIREGIPAEELIATGDQLAMDIVELAKKEREHGQE